MMLLHLSSILLLSTLTPSLSAFQLLPEPAVHVVHARATYPGGWAIAFNNLNSTCPYDAPIHCDDSYKYGCCPSGQFCFGSSNARCCPSDVDCRSLMKNLPPICADQSWNLFDRDGKKNNFFCCHQGMVGVIPKGSGPGICLDPDQNVAASLLATPVSQSGYTATNPVPLSTTVGNGAVTPAGDASTGKVTASGTGSAATSRPTSATAGTNSGQALPTSNPIIVVAKVFTMSLAAGIALGWWACIVH